MKPASVNISKRGYVLLPSSLRKEMGIRTRMRMLITKPDNKIVLQPMPSFTDKLAGVTAKSCGESTEEVQKHVDEDRKDR